MFSRSVTDVLPRRDGGSDSATINPNRIIDSTRRSIIAVDE